MEQWSYDKINNQLQKLSDRVTIVEQQIKELKEQAEIHRKELQAQQAHKNYPVNLQDQQVPVEQWSYWAY